MIRLPASKLIALVFLLVETTIIAAIFTFPSRALDLTAALMLSALLALIVMVVLRTSPASERMPWTAANTAILAGMVCVLVVAAIALFVSFQG
ncbi:MAG: hypothetical protein RMJ55_13420 [Roseiflexaceae bacterium]|nr:hypothetical protein [Roseiflexus sp.]MCS7289012.1 hypothetical protein [Roseiflexus sp.]MDW8148434.1 hypothetical protein [Roseiflexaceae bacterium]MDW8214553.1 hypothetical protein [Roseiflexaceae bacterium]